MLAVLVAICVHVWKSRIYFLINFDHTVDGDTRISKREGESDVQFQLASVVFTGINPVGKTVPKRRSLLLL